MINLFCIPLGFFSTLCGSKNLVFRLLFTYRYRAAYQPQNRCLHFNTDFWLIQFNLTHAVFSPSLLFFDFLFIFCFFVKKVSLSNIFIKVWLSWYTDLMAQSSLYFTRGHSITSSHNLSFRCPFFRMPNFPFECIAFIL